jgi:hypothetical protein
MAEIGKWHGMAINGHWYEKTALSIKPNKDFLNTGISVFQPVRVYNPLVCVLIKPFYTTTINTGICPITLVFMKRRFGDDKTVFAFRQGRNARVIPFQRYTGDNTMIVADHVAEAILRYNIDKVFIDGVGVGGGERVVYPFSYGNVNY